MFHTREVLYFVDNLLLFPPVKEFSKLVNIRWSYFKKLDTTFFETVYKVSLFCRYQHLKKLSVVGSSADRPQILRKKSVFGYDCASIHISLEHMSRSTEGFTSLARFPWWNVTSLNLNKSDILILNERCGTMLYSKKNYRRYSILVSWHQQ